MSCLNGLFIPSVGGLLRNDDRGPKCLVRRFPGHWGSFCFVCRFCLDIREAASLGGGLQLKSHPTWIVKACALRGPRPAQSPRLRPREF